MIFDHGGARRRHAAYQSGLSITEWQPITGILPPLAERPGQAEFESYQQIPRFKVLNSWMTLSRVQVDLFLGIGAPAWGPLIGVAFALPLF